MKPIAIFRHLECEGPGYFATFLQQHKLPFQLICIDQQETVPTDIGKYCALVFMGGPMSVNDDLPWIDQELNLIKLAARIDMPILGHCLGGQLIAKALGGTVTRNQVKEIGWHPVTRIDNASTDDWLHGLPDTFEVFHWHGETFSIPEGAEPLLSSPFCQHQAFAIGNTLALQCHVEMTVPMVEQWVSLYQHELQIQTDSLQSEQQILDNVEIKTGNLQPIANTIYNRWLQGLGIT
jgi:GMP synthase-like glutamine amidotransferase